MFTECDTQSQAHTRTMNFNQTEFLYRFSFRRKKRPATIQPAETKCYCPSERGPQHRTMTDRSFVRWLVGSFDRPNKQNRNYLFRKKNSNRILTICRSLHGLQSRYSSQFATQFKANSKEISEMIFQNSLNANRNERNTCLMHLAAIRTVC